MKNKTHKLKHQCVDERDQKEVAWGVQDKIKARACDVYHGAKCLHKENKNLKMETEIQKREVESMKNATPQSEKQLKKNCQKELTTFKKKNNMKAKRMQSRSKRTIKQLEKKLKKKYLMENDLDEARKIS